MKKIYFLFIVLIIILGIIIVFVYNKGKNFYECRKAYLNYNNTKIELDVANTDSKRRIGLMFVKKLEENRGMFFVFDEEKEYTFWMKNTYIPLDIIFISKDMKINKIFKNIRASFPDEIDGNIPKVTAKGMYVLELNAYMVDKIGLVEGAYITIKCISKN
ncbi:MAG: DUF192 domain-containing protein [Elusimicrobiales bacterium]|nr:DUF192 domain-containing protein [Elusimicrobiales bacterium]